MRTSNTSDIAHAIADEYAIHASECKRRLNQMLSENDNWNRANQLLKDPFVLDLF